VIQTYNIAFRFLLAAGDTPPGSIISFDQTLLVQTGIKLINFLILAAVLTYVLYKPVKKFMALRSARIKNEIEAARSERDEAFELKEKYERMTAELEREREDILTQAHEKAMERSDQILFEARREAEAMYSRALQDIEMERENMQDEIKKQMVEISMIVASRFVEVSIDADTQDRYIEEAFQDWEGR
jgi:F-type H+-transporting ATPase subunit b